MDRYDRIASSFVAGQRITVKNDPNDDSMTGQSGTVQPTEYPVPHVHVLMDVNDEVEVFEERDVALATVET